jgi:hypothetical protein
MPAKRKFVCVCVCVCARVCVCGRLHRMSSFSLAHPLSTHHAQTHTSLISTALSPKVNEPGTDEDKEHGKSDQEGHQKVCAVWQRVGLDHGVPHAGGRRHYLEGVQGVVSRWEFEELERALEEEVPA